MNTIQTQTSDKRQGFTLLELSIVLVIIGLIVGGVLVGQDLIKAAEIRATVSQYEKYNTALNTFRTKYNGVPGDLLYTQASAFGLFAFTDGTQGEGDGNGVLEAAGASDAAQIGEPLAFWRHVSEAGLIDGSYGNGTKIDTGTGAATGSTAVADFFPSSKVGGGVFWAAGSASGQNYYLLSTITAISGTDATYKTANASLPPTTAYNIDIKVDDGLPNTGSTQTRGTVTDKAIFGDLATSNAAPSATSASTSACTVGAAASNTANTYNRSASAGGLTPNCALRLRFN
ncbi:MAG: prepilin-type N-terminal cleavage/methylation domain-containing protein [Alphaproteobacteria bacterium]|nr:prepilin-type N-terminal cleavage/methylation domain-containing protein [Alphaproteobacteria bacterium]